jgi:hypothetical protein
VGWKKIDSSNMPRLQIAQPRATPIGAGAMIIQQVTIPVLGKINISAKAKAYIVDGSGKMGDIDPLTQEPIFKPTFWVKLVGGN